MNIRSLPVIVVLFSVLMISMPVSAATPEEIYFETRDNFIRQLAKADTPVDDRPAIMELEQQMKAIIGPINIEGFPTEGKINFQALVDDVGFVGVDGLTLTSKQEHLFVTTDKILMRYLEGAQHLPRDLAELSKAVEFYNHVFALGGAVTYYAELPVQRTKATSYVRAFIGVAAQDIGPIVPREIFIFLSKGNRVF